MIQLFKMAIRDLGRNRRRSFFSALALAMGLALLLLMAAVIEGEMRGSLDTSIRLNSGHMQLRANTYNEDKTSLAWADLIENPDQLVEKLTALDAVEVATPRLFASGILSTGEQNAGVRIIGVEPESEANAPFRNGLVSGTFLTADDREGLVIGESLAKKRNLKVGDQVNLLVNTSNGDVDEQPFTVRGIYTTHTPAYDQRTVFLPLSKAQAIAKAENHASTIFVMLKEKEQAAALADAMQTNQYQVLTWETMNAILTQTEEMTTGYMVVLYLIILGITATVIVNTLVMAVFERTREIGILSAIGMRGSRIMAMFFAESSLLAVGGILMGLVIGAGLVYYASTVGFYIGDFGVTGIMLGERIYAYLTVDDTITLTVLSFVITLVAALYPALLAANMEPVEALRGGK